jgi:Spy/CpxP family protein refolding chaperone
MYRQKYLAWALVAGLIAAATPALAQTDAAPKSPAPADSARRMKDPISRMLEQRDQLKLTDDQVRQLEQIRTKYQKKYQGQIEHLRRSHEARSALRAGMDSARAEIAGVLTPEQEKQVDAMREQWRREWKDSHRHHGPHARHDSTDG